MGFCFEISLRSIEGRESADHGRVAPQTLAKFLRIHLSPFAGEIYQHGAGRDDRPLSTGCQEGTRSHGVQAGDGD